MTPSSCLDAASSVVDNGCIEFIRSHLAPGTGHSLDPSPTSRVLYAHVTRMRRASCGFSLAARGFICAFEGALARALEGGSAIAGASARPARMLRAAAAQCQNRGKKWLWNGAGRAIRRAGLLRVPCPSRRAFIHPALQSAPTGHYRTTALTNVGARTGPALVIRGIPA